MARNLAQFRATLIEELSEQPIAFAMDGDDDDDDDDDDADDDEDLDFDGEDDQDTPRGPLAD